MFLAKLGLDVCPMYEVPPHFPEQPMQPHGISHTHSPSLPASVHTSHPCQHHISTCRHPIIHTFTLQMTKPPQSATPHHICHKMQIWKGREVGIQTFPYSVISSLICNCLIVTGPLMVELILAKCHQNWAVLWLLHVRYPTCDSINEYNYVVCLPWGKPIFLAQCGRKLTFSK